ncbi:MAG: D-alanyl-D-alanine carboxypeptidase/D-alanyl-D-alanine-endopeptidase [Gemmatimonadota bacterium]
MRRSTVLLVLALAGVVGLWLPPSGVSRLPETPENILEAVEPTAAQGQTTMPVEDDPGAPPPLLPTRVGMPSLLAEMDRILPTSRWNSARWGILVISATHGDTLLALNPAFPLAPASNAKIFTSAGALHALGPDFRFSTFVLADGVIRDGVLLGDLILYGTGDPTVSDRGGRGGTRTLQALARDLRSQGIEEIRGSVVGDGTFFEGPSIHESWNPGDLNDWFTAPVSALSFNENVATVRVIPGRNGAPPSLRTIPEGAPLAVDNRAVTVDGTRSSLLLARDHPSAPVRLEGQMGQRGGDAWRVLTVPDPALFAASALRRALEEEGITVRGGPRSVTTPDASRVTGTRTWAPGLAPLVHQFPDTPGDGAVGTASAPRVLAVVSSPPLSEILEVVNRRSHNLFAEVVLRTLGRLEHGEGSFVGGSRALSRILVEKMAVPGHAIRIVDGSGLSRDNRSSPGALVQVLDRMGRSPFHAVFASTLPEAGSPTGLQRMYRTEAAGNLKAKTGTIDRVSSLAGMVRSGDGEELLFAILANDVPSTAAAKRLEDQLGVQLAAFRRPALTFTPEVLATEAPAEADVEDEEVGGSVRID